MDKVIAIDFDGCLCENKWPEIGKANGYVFEEALAEQKNGAKLILWTNREGKLLEEAIEFCSFFGLHFDAVNESLPDWIEHFGSNPRKIGATEYWDDKAVHKEYKPCPDDLQGVVKEMLKIIDDIGQQNAPEQPQEPDNVKRHRELCEGLNRLYAAKNADYGDSFHKSYVEWGLPMAAIRLGDKYNRFCRLIQNVANVKDESIRDTLIDLANYALMTVLELDRREQNK